MRRILAQARKELTQIVRDRLALALALVLPLILLFLLSTAISLTVHDLPLVIQDLDSTLHVAPLRRRVLRLHLLPRGLLAARSQAGRRAHRQRRARC